jgi:hypothetical protein
MTFASIFAAIVAAIAAAAAALYLLFAPVSGTLAPTTAEIPLPGTLALLGVGLIVIGIRGLKRDD